MCEYGTNLRDQTFDTRIAATTALKSFFLGSQQPGTIRPWNDKQYLTIFSALYDGLIDDDDEIREVAASAAAGLTSRYMVASEAADYLVSWLAERFGKDQEFGAHVVCRMVGQGGVSLSNSGGEVLTPAEKEIKKALDFDDSLFAAEEQNLFVDEVRETGRWRGGAFYGLGEGEAVKVLVKWVVEGLEYIVSLVGTVDGPLGWTTDQHVFAVCARVVMCARGLVKRGDGGEEVGRLLERFRSVGEGGRVHGVLLEMAGEV